MQRLADLRKAADTLEAEMREHFHVLDDDELIDAIRALVETKGQAARELLRTLADRGPDTAVSNMLGMAAMVGTRELLRRHEVEAMQ